MADPSDANAGEEEAQGNQSDGGSSSDGSSAGPGSSEGQSAGDHVDADGANGRESVMSGGDVAEDDGPGWMPAILAGVVLSGIIGFLFCGFSTWLLFQRRTELATRTIRDSYLPQLAESRLDPDTKEAVVAEVQQLANDLSGGKYDNAQSSAILQRLQRIPVLQWGELQAVEEYHLSQSDSDEARLEEVHRDITRLQRGVELGKITSFDYHEILLPAMVDDPRGPTGFRLKEPMTVAAAEEVFQRLSLSVDQSEIPDVVFDGVRLQAIVAEAVEKGATEGGY